MNYFKRIGISLECFVGCTLGVVICGFSAAFSMVRGFFTILELYGLCILKLFLALFGLDPPPRYDIMKQYEALHKTMSQVPPPKDHNTVTKEDVR